MGFDPPLAYVVPFKHGSWPFASSTQDMTTAADHRPQDASRPGRIPEIMIIGAAKSATTNLFNQLCHHPNIYNQYLGDQLAGEKEPSFFSFDENYAKGLEWYTRPYAGARPDELCIDASTNYTRWPQLPMAAQRMAKHAPNARLIYMLRHPVERAYSHYVHRYTRELHPGEPLLKTFEEHVQSDPMCIDSSLYLRQIEQYLEHYPRSALHVVLTTDFKRDPTETLRGIYRFLDIDAGEARLHAVDAWDANVSARSTESRVRRAITTRFARTPLVGPLARRLPQRTRDWIYKALAKTRSSRATAAAFSPKPMTDEMRAKYLAFFEQPNQELSKFLGRDLSEWSR